MKLSRLLRHLFASHQQTRRRFTPAVLAEIEAAIRQAERGHAGEIRFAIDTALPLAHLWHDRGPRERALEVFARLHVWDTSANNGVLIYVLLADRAVEIIADRGVSALVPTAEWEGVCRQVEAHYRAGRYAEGSRIAVEGVGRILSRHFPATGGTADELPNQPILL
jgi:uncharacterized membrane protein